MKAVRKRSCFLSPASSFGVGSLPQWMHIKIWNYSFANPDSHRHPLGLLIVTTRFQEARALLQKAGGEIYT